MHKNLIKSLYIGEEITALKFSPDDSLIAVGCRNGEIKLYDWCTNKLLMSLLGHTGKIKCLDFNQE